MSAKEISVLVLNGVVLLVLGALVVMSKLTLPEFFGYVGALVAPGALGILVHRDGGSGDAKPPVDTIPGPPPTPRGLNKMIFGTALLIGCGASTHDVEVESARAKNAVDLAAYTTELAACRDQGKAMKSFAHYEACAEYVDRRYGVDGGAP